MPTVAAVLVMESRGYAPAVRSISFGGNWSKLYQAGERYLDMNLKAGERSALLQGQLLGEGLEGPLSGRVTLAPLEPTGATLEVAVERDGSFRLEPDTVGHYRLELALSDGAIVIDDLELS